MIALAVFLLTIVELSSFVAATAVLPIPIPVKMQLKMWTVDDQKKFMKNVVVFYPWKNLTLECVFECSIVVNSIKVPETVWLALWIDDHTTDAAAIITLESYLYGGCSMTVSRDDDGNAALMLCLSVRSPYAFDNNGSFLSCWYPFLVSTDDTAHVGFNLIAVY
jgi:hypothetical protein